MSGQADICNGPSLTRPLLLTKRLWDTGIAESSTRFKAERKHQIWGGAFSSQELNLGPEEAVRWGWSRTLFVSSRKGQFVHNVPASTTSKGHGELDKGSKDSCLSQDWEAGNVYFIGPQEGKELCLLTTAGPWSLNIVTTKSTSKRNSKEKQQPHQASPAVNREIKWHELSRGHLQVKVKSLTVRA